MAKCNVCGETVNLKKNHISYHKDSSVIDYYDSEGFPVYKPMKSKTYEHVECSDVI